jgi:methylenetetrahydrofolate dehydrogenase (NADP+)/methenyltetrahydrofolate cyclohydrolase
MAELIDGKKLADSILERLKAQISSERMRPELVILAIGENRQSEVFISSKTKATERIGISSRVVRLSEAARQAEVVETIRRLNLDKDITGIIVQLPIPAHLIQEEILNTVSPEKDIDCLNAGNMGRLMQANSLFMPCTPKGILRLLDAYKVEPKGKNVVIVNHSILVGKPLAMLLLRVGATVSVCHEFTNDLPAHTREADILITAVGKPHMITAEMVKQGAVVIDAGISAREGKIMGDVDFEAVKDKASLITPVPGGVGPMTVAMVMENLVIVYKNQNKQGNQKK